MRWCKRCCEPDTRPTCAFDEEGICYPCRYLEREVPKIAWAERRKILDGIVHWARENSKSGYDCIIGVSGGKDSTRQALFAREAGLNPLLVSCIYPPERQTERGAENLANLVKLGFDTITVAPAPQTSKTMMRHCFLDHGNLFSASELALYACLPKVALAYQIPLILLGENPAITWGTAAGGSLDYMGNSMRHTNTLRGGDFRPFAPKEIEAKDVYWYRYPSDQEMERGDLKIVYIGYFIPDFNEHSNGRVAIENGLRVREGEDADPENTGSYYNFVGLDDDFVLVNQMLKYLKWGFGMASHEISGAIRARLLTREEGIQYIRKYDGRVGDRYVKRLTHYLGLSVDEFKNLSEKFRNNTLWKKNEEGHWKLINELH